MPPVVPSCVVLNASSHADAGSRSINLIRYKGNNLSSA